MCLVITCEPMMVVYILEKYTGEYASRVENKFGKYAKAIGVRKLDNAIEMTVVVDDSDIKFMTIKEVKTKTLDVLKTIASDVSKNIKPKLCLTSEILGGDILQMLGNSAILFDVPMLIELSKRTPSKLLRCYKALPDKFKLDDVKRLLKKKDGRPYHRNTYQNWLNQLKSIRLIDLKRKTYYKKSFGASIIEEMLGNKKANK